MRSVRSVRSGYVFTALVAFGAILMLPVCGHAQDSTVGGTVMDPSGAVIPGVTMTATHTESGNKFVAVTDETIIPRKGLVGDPIHRVDMRLQKRIAISERVQLFGIFEVFNLFNHANYGSYTTNENNANYGKPSFNSNLAYQPRMLQLGFRTTF